MFYSKTLLPFALHVIVDFHNIQTVAESIRTHGIDIPICFMEFAQTRSWHRYSIMLTLIFLHFLNIFFKITTKIFLFFFIVAAAEYNCPLCSFISANAEAGFKST